MSSRNSIIAINAIHPEEIRVAVIGEKHKLSAINFQHPGKQPKKGNIYRCVITKVEPSLAAAFVDYGADRHGFLPFKNISQEYLGDHSGDNQDPNVIKKALHEGQEILVQVEKEERGNKGAALTTFISLAGRYLVCMPNNPKAGGISRRIEGDERDSLRDTLDQLDIPEDMGLIVRTAGEGKNFEELEWDYNVLQKLWLAIDEGNKKSKAPALIFSESDIIIRCIRDHLRDTVDKIIIDNQAVYQHTLEYIQCIRPEYADRVEHYTDSIPLFSRYQIESQIESAFKHEVASSFGRHHRYRSYRSF